MEDNIPVIAKELYNEFSKKKITNGETVIFDKDLMNEHFVCNPSIPFECDGKTVMAIRYQTLSDFGSKCVFVYKENDIWQKLDDAPIFDLQDPFVAFIKGEIVFGGVRGWKNSDDTWAWVTEFYRGKDIYSLKHFFTGPNQMKDIRLVELENGKIGVFSRPQGLAYRAKTGRIAEVGYIEINSLEELNVECIENATMLQNLFMADEWGGVNQVYRLNGGKLGIIGHIAYGDGEFSETMIRHYYGVSFVFTPSTMEFTKPKIIASRECFSNAFHLFEELNDVIFSGGIDRKENGKAVLYAGVADSFIGSLEIADPFWELN
jgi:hypothetical protein